MSIIEDERTKEQHANVQRYIDEARQEGFQAGLKLAAELADPIINKLEKSHDHKAAYGAELVEQAILKEMKND